MISSSYHDQVHHHHIIIISIFTLMGGLLQVLQVLTWQVICWSDFSKRSYPVFYTKTQLEWGDDDFTMIPEIYQSRLICVVNKKQGKHYSFQNRKFAFGIGNRMYTTPNITRPNDDRVRQRGFPPSAHSCKNDIRAT